MNLLALDIGGANIKTADGLGYGRSWPFPLWKSPEKLAAKLAACLAEVPPHEHIVVTMTGELCDCYDTKREGVRSIVAATLEAVRVGPVRFYQTTGQFVAADEAMANFLHTAASNWHALASYVARYCHGVPAIMIDIGSTTSDIIPIADGQEIARGRTDPERLVSGELVYTGVERSPICAILSHLSWRGASCPIAQEFFATSGDAYLLLGELAEGPTYTDTADGKPFTKASACARLSRMICADREMVSLEEVRCIAAEIRDAQVRMLCSAYAQVVDAMPAKPQTIILSGHGEFLARMLLERVKYTGKIVSLNERLGSAISRCAPAYALAVLAREIP